MKRHHFDKIAGGGLAYDSGDEVPATIKRFAGHEGSTIFARLTLHNMRQNHDETVRGFGARLRHQAGICKFMVKCPCCEADVNYTEIMMRDVLTQRVADPKIQLDLLSNKNQDMTLEEVLKFIEAKEAGGGLAYDSGDEVPATIKRFAGHEGSTIFARLTLHNMRQNHDETVRGFGARLRHQAGICKFMVKCPCCEADVNYTEIMMRDVLTQRVADPKIQLDLLSNKNQDMTLEEVLKFIEAKEAVTCGSLKIPNFQQQTPKVKLLEDTYCVVDIKQETDREMVLTDVHVLDEYAEEIFDEEEAEMSDKEGSKDSISYLNGAEGNSSVVKGVSQDLTNMESSSQNGTGSDDCMEGYVVDIKKEVLEEEDPTDSNLAMIPSWEFTCDNSNDASQYVNSRESSSQSGTESDFGGKQEHVCTKCHKSFDVVSDLSLHVTEGCGEVSDQCPVCQKIFKSKCYLSLHMRVHSGEKPYKCPECGDRFPWQQNLKLHMRIHKGEKPFKCSECGKGFPSKNRLKVHFRRHTGSEPYQCSFCNMKLNSKGDFVIHERTHTGEKPYPCSVCDKRFARTGDRKKHENKVHKETDGQEKQHLSSSENTEAALPGDLDRQRSCINAIWYQCQECEAKFESKSSFMLHMKEHAGDYQCSECKKNFMSRSGLNGHNRIHVGEKLFQCSECEHMLTSKQHLVIHRRMHTGERPFECLLCDMKFAAKSSLKEHMRRHTQDNPYNCSFCSRNYSSKGDLTRHLRTHTGEKPFQCDACKKSFGRRNELTKHVQKAQAINEPHSCTECAEIFCMEVDLKKHMRAHIETMPHQCSKCVQKFLTLPELEIHIKNRHGVKGSCPCLVCNETFSTDNYLMIHMKFHADEKPYQCSKCEKRFHLNESLLKHMKRHTDAKPFQCLECGKPFSAKHSLTSHMAMHTGSLHFPCTECHVTCRSQASLDFHIRTHTGEKPYQCCQCGKRFFRQCDLSKHEKSHVEDVKTYL